MIKTNDLVYIRYRDHVLFKDSDPTIYLPWNRETIGWLDYKDDEYLRLVWERFAMPDLPNESKIRATGLVILKEAILEMRKIDNVEKISVVAGEYDIVIRVQVKSLENLLKVTNKIQMIDGVKKTTTQVIEKEIAL